MYTYKRKYASHIQAWRKTASGTRRGQYNRKTRICTTLTLKCLFAFAFLVITARIWKACRANKSTQVRRDNAIIFKQLPEPVLSEKKQRRKGVSLVSACQGNHEILRHSLPSWIGIDLLTEVILIDWSSEPALYFLTEELEKMVGKEPPLYVLRVNNQSSWDPARAFNLGFKATNYEYVVKVDCGHSVRRDFLRTHSVREKSFYVGGKHLERSAFDEGLKGTMLIAREAYIQVGGYDERLLGGAAQNQNLLERLKLSGMKKMDIDYRMLRDRAALGQCADNEVESADGDADYIPEFESAIDLHIIKTSPLWSKKMAAEQSSFAVEPYEVNVSISSFRHVNIQYRNVQARTTVKHVRDVISPIGLLAARRSVLDAKLRDDFNIPTVIGHGLLLKTKAELFHLLWKDKKKQTATTSRRLFVVHCKGDLVSRLLAVSSAFSFSGQTARLLAIIWEKGADTKNAAFSDLFDVNATTFVVDDRHNAYPQVVAKGEQRTFFKGAVSYDFTNKLQNSRTVIVRDDPALHIFCKINSGIVTDVRKHTSDMSVRNAFQKISPHHKIQEFVQTLEDTGLSEAVGVYVAPQFVDVDGKEFKRFRSLVLSHTFAIGHGSSRPHRLYIDASHQVLNSFKQSSSNSLLTYGPDPCSEVECAQIMVARALAISKTLRFFSFTDDTFARFARALHRNPDDW